MGWAYGTSAGGREIGYGVEAVCDLNGCDVKIDRGIDYLCDGSRSGLEVVMGGEGRSCGGYFCADHNYFLSVNDEICQHG